MALYGGIPDEIIQMRVIRQRGGIDDRRVVVHQLPEEAEDVRLGEPFHTELAKLDMNRFSLAMQCGDDAIEFDVDQTKGFLWRQPCPESTPR